MSVVKATAWGGTWMMGQRFAERVRAIAERNNSLLCVGLDPTIERFPAALREQFATDPAGALTSTLR